jgi:hypothetical protein
MPHPSSLERERRLKAAPFALVLLFWGLGLGPLAHAVFAHGEPVLHESGDSGWVQHTAGQRGALPSEAPLAHHHSPGALEHLQLAIASATVTVRLVAVVVAVKVQAPVARQAPALRRWQLPEVPGAA